MNKKKKKRKVIILIASLVSYSSELAVSELGGHVHTSTQDFRDTDAADVKKLRV